MQTLTLGEFKNNISKYLKQAVTEHILIKTEDGVFDISAKKQVTENPSPSNDPFWETPENLNRLKKDVDALKNVDRSQLKSWSSLKEELSL